MGEGELRGTVAVTHPSYTPDFSGINENAIRHDVLKLKELGFAGSLLVAEVNVTPEENARIAAVAREAAGPDFALFFHAIFGTLEENIHAANLAAEAAGADRALLAYPASFWPTSYDEVFDYTKAFCDETGPGDHAVPASGMGFRADPPGGHAGGLRSARAGRDPQHRGHQVRAGLPRDPRGDGDVSPLPRRGGDLLPHRGRDHPADVRAGLPVLGHQQHATG